MTILDHPIHGFDLRSQDATPGAGPRSSGIHLSGILRKMALQYGKLPPEYANDDLGKLIRETPVALAGDSATLCRLGFGFAWETWIVRHTRHHWANFTYQPGEFERDGIVCTPDAISEEPDGTPATHSFKLTWKSMGGRKPISGEWLWLAQIIGEAAAISDTLCCPCTKAYLHVAYVNGDYKRDGGPGNGPHYRVYDMTTTPEEIEMAWGEFMQHRDLAEPENWEVSE